MMDGVRGGEVSRLLEIVLLGVTGCHKCHNYQGWMARCNVTCTAGCTVHIILTSITPWSLSTGPDVRFFNFNRNVSPWFFWWSGGKIKWWTTFQNTWGEVDGQAGKPCHPRHNLPLQTAGWCESWSQALHYVARKYSMSRSFILFVVCILM